MAGMSNYVAQTMALRDQIQMMGVRDPVAHIERPGGGDPPRWVFVDGHVARGGAEATAYLRGMVAGLQAAGANLP